MFTTGTNVQMWLTNISPARSLDLQYIFIYFGLNAPVWINVKTATRPQPQSFMYMLILVNLP